MPLGQMAGQGVILRLAPICEALAAEAVMRTPDDIGSRAFAADLSSRRHEALEPRIFRS